MSSSLLVSFGCNVWQLYNQTSLESILDGFPVYRNTVTAYRTNFIVIMPKAMGHSMTAVWLTFKPSQCWHAFRLFSCKNGVLSESLFSASFSPSASKSLFSDSWDWLLSEAVSSFSMLSVDLRSLVLFFESSLCPYSFPFLTIRSEFSYSLSNACRAQLCQSI